MFSRLSRNRPVSPAHRGRRPSLESLEGRQLMTLGAELPGTVNAQTYLGQFTPDNATNAGGSSVVVWETQYSYRDLDIHAQRLNSSGGKIGPEITVAASLFNEVSPTVAIDDAGAFVVAWNQVQPGGTTSILEAQRFDPNGNAVGNPLIVATGTIYDPDVAIDRYGDFVVTYSITTNGNTDVHAQRYNAGGQLLNVISVASSSSFEGHGRVAMTPDGRFDITYEQAYSTTDHDVYMKRYDANGSLLGTNVISFSGLNDETPEVSVDNSGNGVVVWEQAGAIKAQRFTSAGALGTQSNVSSPGVTGDEPSVAMRRDGGGFVVSFVAVGRSIPYQVVEVTPSNAIRTFDAPRGIGPLSIDAFGNYLMTYAATDQGDYNIHARRGYIPF